MLVKGVARCVTGREGALTRADRSAKSSSGLPHSSDHPPFAEGLPAVLAWDGGPNATVTAREESGVDFARSLQGDVDAFLRVSGRRVEVLGDRRRRESLEVVEAQDVSVTEREQREHLLDDECMFHPIGAQVRDLLRGIDRYLDALDTRTLTPIVTTQVAHRRSEPRFRIVNPYVLREECQPRFLHERLRVGDRDIELSNGNGEEQSPIVAIHALRIGVHGSVELDGGGR